MAKVSVLNVAVLENPSPFHSPFRFEISFECNEALADDLEWKIIYVGSAESEEFDQILDSVLVGPVPAGRHMFVFQVRKTRPWTLTPRNVLSDTKAHRWFTGPSSGSDPLKHCLTSQRQFRHLPSLLRHSCYREPPIYS
uniref:Anti-silencing function 1B histone chaperone n=1 Tax=Capra hircus TaxID=9925 RepID=A0A8C2RS28_CAPHI